MVAFKQVPNEATVRMAAVVLLHASAAVAPLLPDGQMVLPSAVMKGERHTGTNFFATLLSKNYRRKGEVPSNATAHCGGLAENFCATPGALFSGCDRTARYLNKADQHCCWKHGLPCTPADYFPHMSVMVVLVRSPYAFLHSLYNVPYNVDPCCGTTGKSFSQYLLCDPRQRLEWCARMMVAASTASVIIFWVDGE